MFKKPLGGHPNVQEGLTHSSENGSRWFWSLSRDLRFVSKLAVSLAKAFVEFKFKHGK